MDIRLGRFLNKEQCQGCHKIFLSTINLLFALTVMKLHMKNVLQIFLILTKFMKNGNAGNVKVISQKGIIHSVIYFTINITQMILKLKMKLK